MKRIDLRLALYYRAKARKKEAAEREAMREYVKLQDDHLVLLRRNKHLMIDSIQYLKDIAALKQEIYLLKRSE